MLTSSLVLLAFSSQLVLGVVGRASIDLRSRAPSCKRTYTSKKGDTCASIGSKYGMTSDEVKAANSFLNCYDIWANTPICITTAANAAPSCKRKYSSKKGDTCATIGGQFGMTADEVKAANSFLTCNDIWVNTPICITTVSDPSTDPLPQDPLPSSSQPAATTPAPLPSPQPSPQPLPEPSCEITYISRQGDECDCIADMFGISQTALTDANSFVNCNDIWPNTPLCIPPGGNDECTEVYTSKAGDTCRTIGDLHGYNWEVIKHWNQFVDCNNIWKNTPICVAH